MSVTSAKLRKLKMLVGCPPWSEEVTEEAETAEGGLIGAASGAAAATAAAEASEEAEEASGEDLAPARWM